MAKASDQEQQKAASGKGDATDEFLAKRRVSSRWHSRRRGSPSCSTFQQDREEVSRALGINDNDFPS